MSSCNGAGSYTVSAGETLHSIAEKLFRDGNYWRNFRKPDGTPFTEDEARNLRVGEVVCIPGFDPRPPRPPVV
ncbi:hypothetical protein [Chroococcidiopsis sp. CCALA 051]|uniref:hypothetical protein n=1 Tax=Chroococcidiopsis sp. CCALA 051 TaxID=869949 RepID=UPI000D0CEEDA|nr:hypothetical protein [Chroococcidiopsis sp. CCALA 051]